MALISIVKITMPIIAKYLLQYCNIANIANYMIGIKYTYIWNKIIFKKLFENLIKTLFVYYK